MDTNFWGIDVGGEGKTIAALITEKKGKFEISFQPIDTVQSFWAMWLRNSGPVAIDAPLSYDITSPNGMREIDRHWRKKMPQNNFQNWISSPHSLQVVPLKGIWLAKKITSTIIECHPRVGMYVAGDNRKDIKKALETYKLRRNRKANINKIKKSCKIISEWLCPERGNFQLINIKKDQLTDDYLDALFCALLALTFANNPTHLKLFDKFSFPNMLSNSEETFLPSNNIRQMFIK